MHARVLDPGPAPTSSAGAFLWWGAGLQRGSIAAGIGCGIAWMTGLSLVPAALGRAIDDGMVAGDLGALVTWALVLLLLAAVIAIAGAARHWFAVQNWLDGAFRTVVTTDHAVTTRGQEIAREVPTGDVLSVTSTDMERIGGVYDVTARFAGALVAYAVVAAMLVRASLETGLVVLIGGPVLMASLALIIRPLQRRQEAQREQSGRLTTLGTDTVAGLRVLRGIGGEDVFVARYAAQSQHVRASGVRVAGLQAALDSAQQLLPGLFVVLVVWTGARAVIRGELSPGELVSFYGYATFLTMPLRTVTEMVEKFTRARVAANRVIRILRIDSDYIDSDHRGTTDPDVALPGATRPGATRPVVTRPDATAPDATDPNPILWATPDRPGTLVDPDSGAEISLGIVTAIVSARPEECAALADRLGRLGPAPNRVTLAGMPIADVPIGAVRDAILVSDPEPRLFSGRLDEGLCAGREVTSDQRDRAITAANAQDVLDGLPQGWASDVDEQGRAFSGGQRQRLALARVLAIDPPVLVLIEPTSAVDAHTEARIGQRLKEIRGARTTVLATASPLLLQHADDVLLLEDGVVTGRGTHRELLAGHAAYRRIVLRGGEDE